MKLKAFGILFISVFISSLLPAPSSMAGQVVTDSERSWARSILEQVEREKSLPPPSNTNSVAVLYYHNQSGNFEWDPLQKGMALMLNHDFNKINYKLDVRERVKLQALVEELGMGASGLVDAGSAARIGRLLEAQYLPQGTISRGETASLQLNPKFLKAPTEDALDQSPVMGDINELTRMEKEILFDTLNQMQIELTADERTMLGKPMSDNPMALMAFFKGVDKSDNGEYAQAAELYKQALAEDPNLAPAEDAVAELEKLKLVEPEEPPPPEKKEMSTTKKVMIGAGAALAVGAIVGGAVAGAVYAADALSDDDDDGGGDAAAPAGGGGTAEADDGGGTEEMEEEPDTERPYITHTTPVAGSTVECKQGEVLIHWSEVMDPGAGYVATGPPTWNDDVWILDWSGDLRILRVYWEHPDTLCDPGGIYDDEESLILEMRDFRDANHNPQAGTNSFKFGLVNTIP